MPRWSARFADLGGALCGAERWLLPSECLLCGRPDPAGGDDPLICPLCRARWRRLPEPICARCGQPQLAGTECRICAAWPPGLASVRSAVWLDPSSRHAIHQLKYGGWPRAAEALAAAMVSLLPPDSRVLLIPIPLAAGRRRERGYNQSAEIARGLARAGRGRLAEGLLRRVRGSATQTVLTPAARAANVQGAFAAGPMAAGKLILVDDVFTTGATLAEAARALLGAGAERVGAVTFARARPPLGA